jgi:acyl-CoA thioesterase
LSHCFDSSSLGAIWTPGLGCGISKGPFVGSGGAFRAAFRLGPSGPLHPFPVLGTQASMARKPSPRAKGLNPFGDLIGLRFTACRDGYSRCEIEVHEDLLNPHGVLHGGVLYSMADTGMGAALYPSLAENELCATVEVKIAYFLPVRRGTVTCDTKVVHRRKTVAFLESEMAAQEGIVAKATGTYSIFQKREPGQEAKPQRAVTS